MCENTSVQLNKGFEMAKKKELCLTAAEDKVFKIVSRRVENGKTVTTQDVSKSFGGKHRSYVYRILKRLIDKGLVTRYLTRYYSVSDKVR
jgi:predicted transcriptional regulator